MTATKGFITGAATTALDTRKAAEAGIVANAAGAVRVGLLTDNPDVVTSDASTAPMRVAVAKVGFVTQRAAGDGVAEWTNDGSVFLTVTKPGSNSWYVVVYAKHNDTTQGDGDNLPVLAVVTGTAAASPSVPSIPAGALEVARILIPSTATSTQSAGVVITNTAPITAKRGGIVKLRTQAEQDAWTPSDGARAIRLDTDTELVRDGGAWVPVSSPWQSYTPTWAAVNSAPSIGNGTLVGRWRWVGPKMIALRIYLSFGSTTNGGTGGWSFSFPAGVTAVAALGEQIMKTKAYLAGLAANFDGPAIIAPGGAVITPMLPINTSDSYLNQVRNADASSGVGTGVPLYPSNFSFLNGANLVLEGFVETA